MIVCLIAEGSYPYITGGVSSWINQLMLNMPDCEFKIISISPDRSRKGKYAYTLPPNLTGIHDIFLDSLAEDKGRWNETLHFSAKQLEVLSQLLLCEGVDWPMLFDAFSAPAIRSHSIMDFLLSECFYNLARSVYGKKYYRVPFTQVYWTLRSMYGGMLALLLQDYPRADIYHAASAGYGGMVGAYAAHVHKARFVLTEHGIYTREREEEIIKAEWVKGFFKNMWISFFYQLSNCSYQCADQVVTLFNYNRQIQLELGCPPDKTMVIHNGIDVAKFAQVAASVEQRKKPDPIRVGAVIRVVPIKDIKTMIQAFAVASKRKSNIEFFIMGPIDEDEDYYDECLQYVRMLKLDRVTFTGKVNIMDYLKNMDLLVLTSISEGQPLAILEGLACKLPFITTNVGDCGDLINGSHDNYGPAGRVVPVMDYTAIAEGILELSEHEEMRRQFGRSGYKRVRDKYSFQAFIDGYRAIYTRLGREGKSWPASDSN